MTEAQPFFTWGAAGAQMTPERIASERKVAQALMERGMDYSPVQHWTQGVSRVAQALMGGVDSRMADAAERRNVDADKDMIAGWFGGQKPAVPATAGAAALPPPSVAPAPSSAPVVIGEGGLAKPDAGGVYDADAVLMPNSTAHGPAIAGIETPGSKDPYAAIGPATRTGARAYGKYQVMDFNIGPWTKEVLGRELTPDQFRASPDAQEAVFNQKFGQGAKSPQDAASMWFTGRPAAEGASSRAVTPAGVPYGPTGRSYVDMFTKKLGPTAPPVDSPALALAAPQGGAPAIAAPAATPAPAVPATAPTVMGGQSLPPIQDLMGAINSKYTSEGTKKIAQILLTQQLGDSKATDETREYDLYRRQGGTRSFFDYKVDLKKAGAIQNQVQIDQKGESEFSKIAGKQQAERFNDLAAEGQQARQMISDIDTLTDLGAKIGTGKIAEAKAIVGPYAEALGIKIDGLSEIQAYEAVVNRVAPSLRVKGSGAQSDMELKNFLKSLPTLGNTPEGNAIASEVMKGLQQNKILAAEIGAKALNGEITRSVAEKALRELPDPMENYRKFMKARGTPAMPAGGPSVDDLLKKYGPK
jgi:hypothetical protein